MLDKFEFITEMYNKLKFIHKTRKKLNKNNQYALKYYEQILFEIDRNIVLKLTIIALIILISIYILKNSFNYFTCDWISSIYTKYINFPLSDIESARYFFSAIPQSLSALLAITFTVLLIYLQVSTDKYSIQTVKYIFNGWQAAIVIDIFLITIIYSFFKLGKIRDIPNSNIYPWDYEILIIFVLTTLCCLFLVSFFYKTISNLTPDNFIKNTTKRINDFFIITLNFKQSIRIKKQYINNKILEMKNIMVIGRLHFLDSKNPISTSNYGLVQDIDSIKIKKCSKLLTSVSDDCNLQLTTQIGDEVNPASNILGYIKCSNDEIIQNVEDLVMKAYKINNKKIWMLEDYIELNPFSSFIKVAIKNLESGIAETAIIEFENKIIEYIKARKNFGLTPSIEQASELYFEKNFLDESYNHVNKIMNVAIKESNNDGIYQIIYLNQRIGFESIILQDLYTFKKVTNFYLSFSNVLEDNFVNSILHTSDNLLFKVRTDLEKEKNNHIGHFESFLKAFVYYYGNLIKIFIDKQSSFAAIGLSKLLQMNRNLGRLMYNQSKYQIRLELEQLELELKTENNEYQDLKKELEVIIEKEKIGEKLKSELGFVFYSIGTYVMIKLENEKYTTQLSEPIFDKLADFFKKNNLEETFNKIHFESLLVDNWLYEYKDEEAHFVDTSHIDRFYLLMNALLLTKGKNSNEIRYVDKFNNNQLHIFELQIEKLKTKSNIWNQLLDDKSHDYFDELLSRLKICTQDRDNYLREKIREAQLSEQIINQVKDDIIANTKREFVARNFIKVENVEKKDSDFVYFGQNTLMHKEFFIDGNFDPTTNYDNSNIGHIIGKEIGTGESEYLIKHIFEKINVKENQIHLETFSVQNLIDSKRKLEERGFNATTIVISFNLNTKLWYFEDFIHTGKQSDQIPNPYGTISNIEIYNSRVIPNGTVIILDGSKIGTLKIFDDFDPIITMDYDKNQIIENELREGKITDEQKAKRLNELDEMVNVKALENIKFAFGEQKAGLVLFFEPREIS